MPIKCQRISPTFARERKDRALALLVVPWGYSPCVCNVHTPVKQSRRCIPAQAQYWLTATQTHCWAVRRSTYLPILAPSLQRSLPVGLWRVVYPRVFEATKLTCELPFERHWCSDGNPITLNTAGRVDAARSGTGLRLYAAGMVIPSRCCANRSLADSLAVFISVAAWLAMPHCALINTPINTLCS